MHYFVTVLLVYNMYCEIKGSIMEIGERIRFFRNLKGMTQKHLGIQVGFPEKATDIRVAQYENGSRPRKWI